MMVSLMSLFLTYLFLITVDAVRVIEAGGVYVNHGRVSNPETVLLPGTHILANNITLIRIGEFNCHIEYKDKNTNYRKSSVIIFYE